MAERLKDFKFKGKDNNEMRGRRRENNVELRKNKRVEQTMKRRNIQDDSPTKNPLAQSNVINRAVPTAKDIPAILQDMCSPDLGTQMNAASRCRVMLSKEKNPPIDEVIAHGCVPKLVQMLHRSENTSLQFEAAWALTNIASGTDDHTRVVVNAGAVPQFVKLLSSPSEEVREQSIWALGNIAGDCPELRDYVLSVNILQPLLQILTPASKISMLRNATWALSNLCRGRKPPPDFTIIQHAIPTLAGLLQYHDEEVCNDAAWALSYITDGDNYKIQAVMDAGVIPRLIELLKHPQSTTQTPVLRTLGNLVTGDDAQTQAVINAGGLQGFAHLLKSRKENIRKETCWTVSNVTAGTPQQIQSVIESGLIPGLINCVSHGEYRTRKEAAWAISNLTTGGTRDQVKFLIAAGAVKPMVDLLQVQDAKVVLVVLDGLGNMLKHCVSADGSNACADLLEDCGGVDVIEQLQSHENDSVYKKSLLLIEKYFSEDENAAEMIAPAISSTGTYSFGQSQALVPAFSF